MKIHISKTVLTAIGEYFSGALIEKGGIIGKDCKGNVVRFSPDIEPLEATEFSYIPNVRAMNDVINMVWARENIDFAGFVHSHLNNGVLSEEDLKYVRTVLNNCQMKEILCGIYDVSESKLTFYRVENSKVEKYFNKNSFHF